VSLPEDFGILAVATIVIGFFQILSNTGCVQYLLKKALVNESEINTSLVIPPILIQDCGHKVI
jgi:O-antigen/teichoic acid export membrane protein